MNIYFFVLFLVIFNVSSLYSETAICGQEARGVRDVYLIGGFDSEKIFNENEAIDISESVELRLDVCENGFLLNFRVDPKVKVYAIGEFFIKNEITKLSLLRDETILFIEKSKPFVTGVYLYRSEGFKGFGIEKLITEIESRSCDH